MMLAPLHTPTFLSPAASRARSSAGLEGDETSERHRDFTRDLSHGDLLMAPADATD